MPKIVATMARSISDVQVIHDDVYRLDLGPLLRIHLVFNVSNLKNFHADECHLHDDDTILRPSDTEDVWGMQLGKVSGIINKRHFDKKGVQYQVTFQGYPPSQSKWISKHFLARYPLLITDYESKIGKTGSGTGSMSKHRHEAFG